MLPTVQRKHIWNLARRVSQPWLFLTRDRLGVAALALSLSGLVCLLLPVGATVNGIGGILFGTGLTVGLSTWSNRQQAAKDANLRRQTEVYGPLHAELQNLRERLEEARAGSRSYLQWIDVSGQDPPPHSYPSTSSEEPPPLHCWPEFKTDNRGSLDFSERIRQLLNKMLQLAMEYNDAVESAREAAIAVFAPSIKSAIMRVAHSANFQQWQKERSNQQTLPVGSRPPSPHEWFVRIESSLPTPDTEKSWAAMWLETGATGHYQPATLGWILAGNRERVVQCMDTICRTPSSLSYPPPPREWLQAILDEAWSTLENHPTLLTVRALHEELFQHVSQAEAKVLEKLRYIQDTYEGGPPPL